MTQTMRSVFQKLSWMDRLLPLLILLSIVVGIILSVYVPSSKEAFQGATILDVSVPLAIGMIIMMIPPLAKIQWESVNTMFNKSFQKQIIISLILNWIICPLFMFGLAWLTLFDQEEYRTGIIMIGLARCIAMVVVWNQVSGGDDELCAIIVIINSLLQIVLYAPYKILFCDVIGNSASTSSITEMYSTVSKTIAFFLGIPLVLGVLIRFIGVFVIGKERYQRFVLPIISPWSLIGLLYTIIVLFIEKGDSFIKEIGTAFRCFIPLITYFIITWFSVFFGLRIFTGKSIQLETCGCELKEEKTGKRYCSANYKQVTTQAFTAASNNFELTLAVAIAIYGSNSKQAIAATFGPLIEVPVLLILAFVSRYFEEKFLWSSYSSLE